MQSFWNKFKAGYLRFMQGRYGADQLGLAVIWTSLILNLAAAMCGNSAAASLLTLALGTLLGAGCARLVWMLFMMSSAPFLAFDYDQLAFYGGMAGVILAVALSAKACRLNVLSTAGWIWALWRLLSRNKQKRYAENQWFLARWATIKTPVMQAVARFKNRKKYVYFTCPQCHMKLRLPRGVGQGTVKCSKCGHSFEKKA